MLIKRGCDWEINQREVTDEALFLNRRRSYTFRPDKLPHLVGAYARIFGPARLGEALMRACLVRSRSCFCVK